MLGELGVALPLTVTLEQVTYFRPTTRPPYQPGRLPLWIWMDDPSFYGFPSYGEPTVKAAQDCGGPMVTADDRPFDPDPATAGPADRSLATTSPAAGDPVRSMTCLYTLTPDRDFVLGPVPGHRAVLVGLGAAHGVQVRADLRPAARRPGRHGACTRRRDALPRSTGRADRARPSAALAGVRWPRDEDVSAAQPPAGDQPVRRPTWAHLSELPASAAPAVRRVTL